MTVPGPWSALILVAAAYRLWLLLAEDDILVRPRRWIVNLPFGWEEGDSIPDRYRMGLAKFISCPACFGFWIALAIFGLWEISPHRMEVISTPFAISTGIVLIAKWAASKG